MKQLDDELHAQIVELCKLGDELFEAGDTPGSLREYHAAWELLPEPREDWEAATWILSTIGDTHFLTGNYEGAIAALGNAVRCPDGLGNPFVHLRLGESHFELGNMNRAKDELTRAFMGGGAELFTNEDPKYWSLLKEILRPPPGSGSI